MAHFHLKIGHFIPIAFSKLNSKNIIDEDGYMYIKKRNEL